MTSLKVTNPSETPFYLEAVKATAYTVACVGTTAAGALALTYSTASLGVAVLGAGAFNSGLHGLVEPVEQKIEGHQVNYYAAIRNNLAAGAAAAVSRVAGPASPFIGGVSSCVEKVIKGKFPTLNDFLVGTISGCTGYYAGEGMRNVCLLKCANFIDLHKKMTLLQRSMFIKGGVGMTAAGTSQVTKNVLKGRAAEKGVGSAMIMGGAIGASMAGLEGLFQKDNLKWAQKVVYDAFNDPSNKEVKDFVDKIRSLYSEGYQVNDNTLDVLLDWVLRNLAAERFHTFRKTGNPDITLKHPKVSQDLAAISKQYAAHAATPPNLPLTSHITVDYAERAQPIPLNFHSLIAKYFDVVPCAMDGNCLFHALAHSLPKVGHMQARMATVDYMRSHPEDFRSFVTGSFTDYCNLMNQSGQWGGQLEIVAFTKVYPEVQVIVLCQNEPLPEERGGTLIPRNLLIFGNEKGKKIYLRRTNENHYSALVPKGASPTERLPKPVVKHDITKVFSALMEVEESLKKPLDVKKEKFTMKESALSIKMTSKQAKKSSFMVLQRMKNMIMKLERRVNVSGPLKKTLQE